MPRLYEFSSDGSKLRIAHLETPYNRVRIASSITAWLLATLLSFRALLTFIGASPEQPFVGFIHFITKPLLAPFKPLVPYDPGIIEVHTSIAVVTVILLNLLAQQIVKIASSQKVKSIRN